MAHLYKFLFLFLLFQPVSSYCQQDSLKRKQDSLLTVKLDSQQILVRQLLAERLADSLQRADLENQLSSADRVQKTELLKQLNTLTQNDSIRRLKQKHRVDSLRRFVKGFAVIPFRDTLFYLFANQGSFSARDRAEAIGKRISKLSDNYVFSADSIKMIASEQSTDIVYRDQLLISVSDQDALWQNKSRQKLTEELRTKIGDAVIAHQHETRWQTILTEAVLALLVIAATGMLIYGIRKLFIWFQQKLILHTGWYAKGIHIRNYELLNAQSGLNFLKNVLTVLKWLFILLTIYLALPILFGIFPFTRNVSDTLLNYILSPLKRIGNAVWDYIPNLMTIIVLLVVFRYVLRFFRFIKIEIEKGKLTLPGFYPDWANPTYQIIRVLVLAFMLIVIFPYLPGSDTGVFKGVSVFMGVLFTFGSAGALGNVVAGLVMTYMRAFKIGDRVKIGDVTGDVIEKTLLVTRVRTIKNEIISIPNSEVMNNPTVNFSSDAPLNGLILHTTVTIGYDVPWREVHRLLMEAATITALVETEPKPFVLQTSLDDYYVSYQINAFTKEPNKQAAIYSNLHANIQDNFNKAGIEIMSPHYKALRDGNATTIPVDYLPGDYVPPGFVTEARKKGERENGAT